MNFIKTHRRLMLVLGVLFIFALAGAVFVKYRVGDLRPVLFPSKKNLVETLEKQNTGDSLDLPLTLSSEFKIGVFAKNIEKPRDLQLTPGGDMVVTSPSSGKVLLLLDNDKDGVAEETRELLTGLELPHGVAFYRDNLFVAQLQKVNRYDWDETTLTATFEKTLFTLPKSSGHVTRTLAITPSGTLFVTVGSTCNVCFEKDELLASVSISDIDGNNLRLFATGLRNSVFLKLHPETGELWATENSRDWLGDNAPPDEINIIQDGKNYGWPFCYGNKFHDKDFDSKGEYSGTCATSMAPIFEIQAHSAPLGFTFIDSKQFPENQQGDLLVSYHGSWNRSEPTGYKIVLLETEGNKITKQEDFLTGFLQGSEALGRPVDLEFDKQGSLYISDDKANAVYKIVKK